MAIKRIQRCNYCGKRETRFVVDRKPQLGKCPTRNSTNPNNTKPHVWQTVRKFEN